MGPLPPPVTGMTLLTEKVVQRLREKAPVSVTNWTSGDSRQRLHKRLLRFLLTARCLAKLILHGPVRYSRLYVTANSKGGLIMTGLLVNVARRLGYSIYLHHHAYNYIDSYDTKMAWIDRSMRPGDVHLVHCPQMVDDFRARYGSRCRFDFVYPSIVSLPLGQPRQRMPEAFRLGFLANLSVAKGLDLLLETFRALRNKGRNVNLTLAGPCGTAEAERVVSAALDEFKDSIHHIGGVYGERKVEFFNGIDCFLFPSRSESWGIVLNEALAAGVPVIATNRGCVRTLVGNRAGRIVDDEQRYVEEAVRQVEAWIDFPQAYFAASQAAIEQADYLHREAAAQLERVTSRICSPTKLEQAAPNPGNGV